jgi:hypothetical protein
MMDVRVISGRPSLGKPELDMDGRLTQKSILEMEYGSVKCFVSGIPPPAF